MSGASARVIVFACNWDGLSCVEAAAQAGLTFPASVGVVRLSCLSRLDQGLILRAFEMGAEGVMLVGCEVGKCHFETEAQLVDRECEKARHLLELLGLGDGRLAVVRLPRGEGEEFVRHVSEFVAEVERMHSGLAAGGSR